MSQPATEHHHTADHLADVLKDACRAGMVQFEVPGAIVSVRSRNGDVLAEFALGTTYRPDMLSAHTENKPMTTNLFFRIGSITKSMTATSLLMSDQCNLEDTVAKWFPDAPNAKMITLRHLLNMTSGLRDYCQNPAFQKVWLADPHIQWAKDDLIRWSEELARDVPLPIPGTEWQYCNTGYIYAGLIAERVWDMSLDRVFLDVLFRPLGMTNSALASNRRMPSPHAHGCADVRDVLEDATYWNPRWGWSAGAVISTVEDMHMWANRIGSLHGETGRPLLYDTSSRQSRGVESFDDSYFYGLGLMFDNGWVMHNGSIPGSETMLAHHMPSGTTVVMNINQSTLQSHTGRENVITQLFRRVVEILVARNVTPCALLHHAQ